MAEGPDREQINFVTEAVKWQYNLIALGGAAAFAFVSGSELPLILAGGLELVYLSIIPQMSRFQRLVRSWKFSEQKTSELKQLSQIFHGLPEELRKRYAEVDRIANVIRANYARGSSASQMFVRPLEEKLNGLLQGYVRLLQSLYMQREHLSATDVAGIQREIKELGSGLEKQIPNVREINQRRIDILGKRVEKYHKIRENYQVVDAQCAAIEDVLELIRDQTVTMRDPEGISNQLESLVQDVEHTEQAVREVEAIFELASPGPALPSSGQNRIRN